MYEQYKNVEKRKKYLRQWKLKNRERIRENSRVYFREYMRKRRKNNRKNELIGNCGVGRKYELLALKLLSGSVDNNIETFRGGYDITLGNKKIEVKMRNIRNGGYSFHIRKTCTANYLLLFCVDTNVIKKILLIPRNEHKTSSLYIPNNGKFDKYLLDISSLQTKGGSK